MFSLTSRRDIVLKSVYMLSTGVGVDRVAVYVRPGDYVGHETDHRGWTSVYNNFNNLRGSGEYTSLDMNNKVGVFVPAGRKTSFFVYTESRVRCRDGSGSGTVANTDGVLEVYQGVRMDGRWTAGGDEGIPLAFQGAFV